MSKTCSIEGCDVRLYAKGWCQRHYYRAARNGGDPLAFKQAKSAYDRFDASGNRWCSRCRTYLDSTLFAEKAISWCKQCRRLSRYGITRKQYDALPGADGTCPICQMRSSTHLDHDHTCCPGRQGCGKCTRGVLCSTCNSALGMLTEPGLSRALTYLQGP